MHYDGLVRWTVLGIPVVIVVLSAGAEARPFRVDQLPNGGTSGCDACHTDQVPARTPFGFDAEVTLDGRDVDWSKLYNLDSDGDGFSNGRELGDPCGAWQRGRTPERTTGISNPGDRSSVPDGAPGPTCTCGNGIVDGGEECDDGNLVHRDRCTNYCEATTCGDGVVDPGEVCDDGNDIDTDDCTTVCESASCGDGVVQPSGEVCDDGNFSNSDACTNRCEPAACGDGYVWFGMEACDRGPNNSDSVADRCRTSCVNPGCGDGVVDTGEACDHGAANGPMGPCNSSCVLTSCGDGILDPGEACDGGRTNNDGWPDACRTNCLLPWCGDGVVDAGEACDSGGIVSATCDATCEVINVSAGPSGDDPASPMASQSDSCRCIAVESTPSWGLLVLGGVLLAARKRRRSA